MDSQLASAFVDFLFLFITATVDLLLYFSGVIDFTDIPLKTPSFEMHDVL